MDNTELFVFQFLQRLGFSDITFQPKGQSTPDFLVNDEIAIEVTRLEQKTKGAQPKGLLTEEISLRSIFCSICNNSGPAPNVGSTFVHWQFSRPIELDASVRARLGEALLTSPHPVDRTKVFEQPNLKVWISPAEKCHETRLRIGSYSDFDAGGWIAAEYAHSVELIVRAKEKKARASCFATKSWWLIMPDFFWSSTDPEDLAHIPKMSAPESIFDRVLIVDRSDTKRFVEL